MSGDTVKVAVRVRPFNQRELKANPRCVISMGGGSTTVITNPHDGSEKTFSFDHSYWSHDGFTVGEDGVSVPDSALSKYADQRKVFDDLGRGVLDNAWQGYNAALFAYGQTGSGKSYSMVGYGVNKGIVPITCSELFSAIDKNKDNKKQFQVTFSMLEIYKEQVRDLLVSTRGNIDKSKTNLKVRQRPGQGFYCEGLKQVPVQSYADIERLMDDGVLNRTTASTNMNATSSRSHMVITIGFKQVFPNEQGQSTTKTSEISLVDLAGSERAASTEATGDRLKEGSSINTSLLTLGNVIHALAESSSGKKKVNIPYRGSVLTKLLMTALGGNSKTIMIAALSPAAINYEETLSTLRYADRAKQIKTRAVINENLTDKLIRELREENQQLLEQLKQLSAGGGGDRALDVRKLLEENQRQMQIQNQSWEQRLEQARKEWESENAKDNRSTQEVTSEEMPAQWARMPYLANVNEDPQLSGVIRFSIVKGDSMLGKPGAASVTIEMRGLGIQSHHAIISNTGKDVYITPGSKNAAITINGKSLKKGKTRLKHLDRIKLGSNNLYLYIGFPTDRQPNERPLEQYTYDVFQAELAEAAGFSRTGTGGGGREGGEEGLDPELLAVFEEYIGLLPRVMEVNAMSEDLGKGLAFELQVKNLATLDSIGRNKRKEVIVKISNKAHKVWVWSKEKFMNRKYMMEDLYQKWLDGEALQVDQEHDPFWDPLEDIFLGSVHTWLTGLAYCMETDDHLEVRDYKGKPVGQLHVKLTPSDTSGRPLLEEMLVLDPTEMLGRRLDFVVNIQDGNGLKWTKTDPSRGSFCRFTFYNQAEVTISKTVWGSPNPRYNFTKQLTVQHIDNNFLTYLQANALVVEVWGTQASTDASNGTSIAIQRSPLDSEPETVISFLQEKIKKQEQELGALRKEQTLLNQENARLQRMSLNGGAAPADRARRKSLIDDGHHQPLLAARRQSTDKSPPGLSRRKVGVFLPPNVSGSPLPSPYPAAGGYGGPSPPGSKSPSPTQVSYMDLQNGGPSVTHITPAVRTVVRRRSSVGLNHSPSPPLPSSPATGRRPSRTSVSTPGGSPMVVVPPGGAAAAAGGTNNLQRQVTTPGGGAAKESIDVELVKALKLFFKDMKEVQRRTKTLRKLGEEVAAAGDNGNLKAVAIKQQEGLLTLEADISTHLSGLKDVVLSVIRRRRQEET